jgi:hypothetical protein
MTGEFVHYRRSMLPGGADAGWPAWHLDTPTPTRPGQVVAGGRFVLEAWILPGGASPTRLATRIDGLTRVHEADVERRDVVMKMLDASMQHVDPSCGYRLQLPAAGRIELGLERDGILCWAALLERDDS